MSNQLVEGFFVLAFWAPPLAVLAGALLLLVPDRFEHWVAAGRHGHALTH